MKEQIALQFAKSSKADRLTRAATIENELLDYKEI